MQAPYRSAEFLYTSRAQRKTVQTPSQAIVRKYTVLNRVRLYIRALSSSLMDLICTGFQDAVGSMVTSSNSVLLRLVRMPQMYWSISRPSSRAGLLGHTDKHALTTAWVSTLVHKKITLANFQYTNVLVLTLLLNVSPYTFMQQKNQQLTMIQFCKVWYFGWLSFCFFGSPS